MDYAPAGSDVDIVKLNLGKKNEEPEWMLEWRLGGYSAG